MATIRWQHYRRPDGSIDLARCLDDCDDAFKKLSGPSKDVAFAYIASIENIHPIVSRQAATIAIITAASVAAILEVAIDGQK